MFLGSQQENSVQAFCESLLRPLNVLHSSPWPQQLEFEALSIKSPQLVPETPGTKLQR